jgi:hypothetical protein
MAWVMHMKTGRLVLGIVLGMGSFAAASVGAQQKPPAPMPVVQRPMTMVNPLTASSRAYYDLAKEWLVKSAALMPEADFGFKPAGVAKDVRGFGQILAHVANANYLFCGLASATKGPAVDFEKTATAKADIQKAVAESFAFCDKAWAGTDDKNAATPVTFPDGFPIKQSTRLGALVFSNAHLGEHYGNLVTYFRAKGMVPPSSQGGK